MQNSIGQTIQIESIASPEIHSRLSKECVSIIEASRKWTTAPRDKILLNDWVERVVDHTYDDDCPSVDDRIQYGRSMIWAAQEAVYQRLSNHFHELDSICRSDEY